MDEFKLIVAGGRDFNDPILLAQAIEGLANGEYADKAVSIVSGMARGADMLGYMFAMKHNVVAYAMPADWEQHGKRAGMLRNKEMAEFADGLLLFWDGASKGSKNMLDTMRKLGKPVHVIHY